MRRTCGRALHQLHFLLSWGLLDLCIGGNTQKDSCIRAAEVKAVRSYPNRGTGLQSRRGDLVWEMKAWLMFPGKFHSPRLPAARGRGKKSQFLILERKKNQKGKLSWVTWCKSQLLVIGSKSLKYRWISITTKQLFRFSCLWLHIFM